MDVRILPVDVAPNLALDDPAPGPDGPNAPAAARFSELMEAPGPAGEAIGIEAAAPVASPASSQGHTMGDNILGGLRRVSNDLQNTWSSMSAAMNGKAPFTTQHMLAIQATLSQMTLQFDLVSKGITKIPQEIDQLVKLQ